MPLEVVQRIFKLLSRKELKTIALCSSATRDIAYPILHRSLMLKFHHEEPITKSNCGLSLKYVESILSVVSSEALSCYRNLTTISTLSLQRRRKPGPSPAMCAYDREMIFSKKQPITATDDMVLRLIINRLQRSQLLTIRFGSATSLKTLKLILGYQDQVRQLSLGDVGSYTDLMEGYSIPSTFFSLVEIRLTSLEVGNILRQAALTVLNIIHRASTTLKKLRLGCPNHPILPRFPDWQATVHDLYSGTAQEEVLPFSEIRLAALERLHIVHDHQMSSFADILGGMINGCTRLTRIRLSGCTKPHRLVRRLVAAGAHWIESLQICHCKEVSSFNSQPEYHGSRGSSSDGDLLLPCGSRWHSLPHMDSLHTLQLTGYSHLEDGPPQTYSFANKQRIRRLWVGCQRMEKDPNKCPSTSALLRYSSLTQSVVLIDENWQLLRELAVPHPGPLISELLCLKSLRVLRLLEWRPVSQIQVANIESETNALLSRYSDLPTRKLPSVKLLVVERQSCTNYCSRLLSATPCYLAVRAERLGARSIEANLYRPIVTQVDLDLALSICLRNGCSTYLLTSGPPSAERFWEDAYAFAKDPY
ncbi:hypothetical protein TWF718_007568 [Orbilia javanica]|uniref:F-box domain-containing protein n=1 Tax=Orbilia javanica TaxID=47235 RepID=A0AAN8RNN4_9PEZI